MKLCKNQGRPGKKYSKLNGRSGTSLENPYLEEPLYDWVIENRLAEHSISNSANILKAIYLDPEFKNGNEITLRN